MTSEFFVQDWILGRRNRFLKKLQAKVLSCTGVLLLVLQEFYTTILITLTSFYLNSSHMKDLYPLFFPTQLCVFFPHQSLLVLSKYSKMCGLLLECGQLIVLYF